MQSIFYIVIVSIFFFTSCLLLKKGVKTYQPDMVFVAGGTFTLGDFFDKSNTDALPTHEVKIKPFYIGRTEITFEEYDAFAIETGRALPDDKNFGRGKRAVVNITWDDALAFCKSLGFRLPSEVEWEYAARSRGKNQLFAGTSSLDSLNEYAVTKRSNINFSYLVGTKKPNGLGLYDMTGNVFEWIGEFYQFYSMPEQLHNHKIDAIRIIRGGSFTVDKLSIRNYWRVGTLRNVKASDLGFRCADSK